MPIAGRQFLLTTRRRTSERRVDLLLDDPGSVAVQTPDLGGHRRDETLNHLLGVVDGDEFAEDLLCEGIRVPRRSRAG